MNIRCILSILLTLGILVQVNGQSLYPGQFENALKVKTCPVKAECFDLSDIKLLKGRMRENLERDSAWLMSLQADRLLHSFYNNSGIWGGKEGGYMTVKKYGGWESLDCELRGHTIGHVLSALALMYAATGHDKFKQKGDSLVNGLEKVQSALGNGYLSAFPEELINRNIRGESVWAPWYTLHKILSGLIDQYLYTNNPKALEIARKMGNWAYGKTINIDEETRAKMLRNEFGGINEAFHNLWAITGDEKYCEVARFFYHDDVINPLKAHNDDFGTKHTNTFIPKVIGEMRNAELTGNPTSLDLSLFFWDEMTGKHIFAPGCLSDKEHFFPLDSYEKHITGYTGETCCTYNMLKLARHVFCANPDSKVFDYYERALYNHILGQQDTETGMVAYFLPLATGTHKVYSTPEQSFWCCVGSGFENHAKYAESVYFHSPDNQNLYVNLYIPSQLDWQDRGLLLRQETDFPSSASTSLIVEKSDNRALNLKLRRPSWAREVAVKINGKKQNIKVSNDGYLALKRNWRKGDRIDIDFDMQLRLEPATQGSNLVSLFYGPILLAARLGTKGMLAPAPDSNPELYNDYYTYNFNIPEGIEKNLELSTLRRSGELEWTIPDGTILSPLYDIHRERYQVYWQK